MDTTPSELQGQPLDLLCPARLAAVEAARDHLDSRAEPERLNLAPTTSNNPAQPLGRPGPPEQVEQVPTASFIEDCRREGPEVEAAELPEATVETDRPAVDLAEVVALAEPERPAKAETAGMATLW